LPDVIFISAIHAAIVAPIRRKGKIFDALRAANEVSIHRNPVVHRLLVTVCRRAFETTQLCALNFTRGL
jgi:hypothetical protein